MRRWASGTWSRICARWSKRWAWASYHIVGHSMGGGIVMKYAIAHPADLLSITLVDTVSPYGYSGSKGVEGTPCHDDGAPAGAGSVNPDFVRLLGARRSRHRQPGVATQRLAPVLRQAAVHSQARGRVAQLHALAAGRRGLVSRATRRRRHTGRASAPASEASSMPLGASTLTPAPLPTSSPSRQCSGSEARTT